MNVSKQKVCSNSHYRMCWLLFLLFSLLGLTGCSQFAYYVDVINGHAEVLNRQRPVVEVLQDAGTAKETRQRLANMQAARIFASKELSLPDNDSYTHFSDIKREFVVWNVIAAQATSVQAKQWCYWFVGCMSYRGFYDQAKAQAYAAELQGQGYDVYVAGVRAYSTLGWTEDPVLNTMLYPSESQRVGILFHELAHQVVYREGDSTFNESFASTVEQEGLRRWFLKKNDPQAIQSYLEAQQQDQQFRQLLLTTREQLARTYQLSISMADKQKQKKQVFRQLQTRYQQLQTCWGNHRYKAWMAQPLNNAHLALIATYNELTPLFQAVLAHYEYDMPQFFEQINKLKNMSRENLMQYRQQFPPLPRAEQQKYDHCLDLILENNLGKAGITQNKRHHPG